jgi:FKBP-type peptidyl-prolyl cis-trans isomerase
VAFRDSQRRLFLVHLRPVSIAALVVAGAVAAAGCGSHKSDNSAKKPTASASLSSVTIKNGKAPTLKLGKTPFKVTKTSVKVVKPGTGATVKKGQNVSVNYVLVDGRDGKQAGTTFGSQPQTFPADPDQVIAGIAKGIINQKVGSRVLVGISPTDGFKAQGGNQQLGIQADDSLVLMMDIRKADTPLPHAEGTAVPAKPGLPTAKVNAAGDSAKITVPKTAAPTKLIVQPLIQGKGAVVKKGQTLWAKYTGVIWKTGTVFDSTAQHPGKTATSFPIGVGQVIPGWDQGLVGQRVGSRVLLVVPPKYGYDKDVSGTPIKKTDTLVFVVDIVDVS